MLRQRGPREAALSLLELHVHLVRAPVAVRPLRLDRFRTPGSRPYGVGDVDERSFELPGRSRRWIASLGLQQPERVRLPSPQAVGSRSSPAAGSGPPSSSLGNVKLNVLPRSSSLCHLRYSARRRKRFRGPARSGPGSPSCHGAERQGDGGRSPTLVDVGQRLSTVEIRRIVEQGRGFMPAVAHLPAAEREAIISYLLGSDTDALDVSASTMAPGVRTFTGSAATIASATVMAIQQSSHRGARSTRST